MHDALTGYKAARATTASPRGVERAILRRLAGEIETAGSDYARLAAALQSNTEVWTTLAVDVAASQNGLPPSLRAGILSLANFVGKHSRAVLRDEADPAILCEINRNLAEGLEQADLAVAAAA